MTTTRQKALDAALQACVKARPATYAPPLENFPRVAKLVKAWLELRQECYSGPVPAYTEFDYVVTMIQVKLARLLANPAHFDSWVDIAGFAACGAEVCNAVPPDEADADAPLRLARLHIRTLEDQLVEDRNLTRIAELEALNEGLRSRLEKVDMECEQWASKLLEISRALARAGLKVRDGWLVAQETELPLGDGDTQ